MRPTSVPSPLPTQETASPTPLPTTPDPTGLPTPEPSTSLPPTALPTSQPTGAPTPQPSTLPTPEPSPLPTEQLRGLNDCACMSDTMVTEGARTALARCRPHHHPTFTRTLSLSLTSTLTLQVEQIRAHCPSIADQFDAGCVSMTGERLQELGQECEGLSGVYT